MRLTSSATQSNVSTPTFNDSHCRPREEVANVTHCSRLKHLWFQPSPWIISSRSVLLLNSNTFMAKWCQVANTNRRRRITRSRMIRNWVKTILVGKSMNDTCGQLIQVRNQREKRVRTGNIRCEVINMAEWATVKSWWIRRISWMMKAWHMNGRRQRRVLFRQCRLRLMTLLD